ncbi:unnamed protein product [Arctogadus glacialis]
MVDSERLKRMKDLGGEDEYEHTGHRMLCRTVTDGSCCSRVLSVAMGCISSRSPIGVVGGQSRLLAPVV